MSVAPTTRSDILEIADACRRLSGIDLATGIPATAAVPASVHGAVRALYAGHNTYAEGRGVPALRHALAARLEAQHGLAYDPESELLVTSGITGGFAAAMMSLFTRGDEVILPEPYFGWHLRLMRMAGLTPKFTPLGADGLDIASLEASIGPTTRGLVLCTPNNPSGRVWSGAAIDAVADLAVRHDLIVVTDEQYAEFVFDGREHISPATRAALWPRTVTLGGASKSLSVTGWRIAWAAGPHQLVDALLPVHQALYICPPTPLQHGIAAALPQLDLSAQRAELQDARDLLCEALDSAGFAVEVPQGGFFVLADAAELSRLSSLRLAMTVLERTGVAAVPGRAFVHDAERNQKLRFCFARPRPVLEEAARRIGSMRRDTLRPATHHPESEVEIRELVSEADHAAAAGLAYEVYVEEMGILGHIADHAARRLYADEVDGTTVLGAFEGDRLVGCITLMHRAEAEFTDFYRQIFALHRFEGLVPAGEMAVVTRFLVAADRRAGMLTTRLMAMCLLTALQAGERLFFIDAQPHLVPAYERLGFRAYGAAFNYGDSGVGVPLVAGTFDRQRLEEVGSPMLGLLDPSSADPELAQRLVSRLEGNPVLSRATTPAAHAACTAEAVRLASEEGRIFYGFSEAELTRILERAYVLTCSRDIKLVGRGQKTRSVYLILDGALEARLEDKRVTMGPGEFLGEVAYLTRGERTADVVVTSDTARVLCLSEKTMAALSEGEPALSARFLGNLARLLATRISR